MKVNVNVPLGGEGLGRPKEAILQFALLPSIIGFGFSHALLADSGSRNVTYKIIYIYPFSYIYNNENENHNKKMNLQIHIL